MDPISDVPKKKGRGRRKIPMERIQNKTNRHVTFSKRRANLFKKAGELSTLCGSEIAIIVFSEAGKASTFGHPNANSVIQRYLHGSSSPQLPSLRSDPTTPINYSPPQTANPNTNSFMQGSVLSPDLASLRSDPSTPNNNYSLAQTANHNGGMKDDGYGGQFWVEGCVDNNMGLEELQQYTMAASAPTLMPPCSPLFDPNMGGLSCQNVDGITCEQEQDWEDFYAEMETWFADEDNLVQL